MSETNVLDRFSQEEIDEPSKHAADTPITRLAVYKAVKKLPDSEAGAGELPEGPSSTAETAECRSRQMPPSPTVGCIRRTASKVLIYDEVIFEDSW